VNQGDFMRIPLKIASCGLTVVAAAALAGTVHGAAAADQPVLREIAGAEGTGEV
jgi:hypothetical protein